MVKIGDRVRFLNSVGGGIVRKFQDKNVVLVEEEDGFDTPVLIRECVVVESISSESNMPIQQKNNNAPAPIIIRQEEPVEDYDYHDEEPEGENLNLFLAFLPKDVKQLQTTSYHAYLVNDSNYFLFYTISTLVDGQQKLQAQGKIEPNTKFQLLEINKDALNDWERISVQCLPYKTKAYGHKPAVDVKLQVSPVKFYKLHSFTENDYFSQDALLLTIIQNDMPEAKIAIDPDQLKELMLQKNDAPRRQRIERKSLPNAILEIDLHIDELLDTTAGMSNTEMLLYQMEKFNEVMQANKDKKGQKIVFIHGKGEGVLRTEVLKQLKSKYSNCFVQDASFREYGFGATMVTIK